MNNLEIFMAMVNGILLLLIIVQCVVMVNKKKEIDNLVNEKLNKELEIDKIRRTSPPPMFAIEYIWLEKEVKRYKPPYKVGQKVMYSDEGFAKVGYIHGIRTEQYEIIHDGTDKKEIVVKHSYEIGSGLYTDIIDVVKEDK